MIPSIYHPAFVGGPTLGGGLNASLLRKVQIINYWLDKRHSGAHVLLVQGSPSGSAASGGTHAGPGDAGDFILRGASGDNVPLSDYLFVSTAFRVLHCLSYVRGSDVNGDGVKDDTFDQHIHVIDREGTGKVWAATNQINLYLRHLNGLVNNHPDLERTVNTTLTLAAYSDEAFTAQMAALTGTVLLQPTAHTEPKEFPLQALFMMSNETTPNGHPIYMLTPGQPVRHLTEQEWALLRRLGADLTKDAEGRDQVFNRLEVDIVNNTIQPTPPQVSVVPTTINITAADVASSLINEVQGKKFTLQ